MPLIVWIINYKKSLKIDNELVKINLFKDKVFDLENDKSSYEYLMLFLKDVIIIDGIKYENKDDISNSLEILGYDSAKILEKWRNNPKLIE